MDGAEVFAGADGRDELLYGDLCGVADVVEVCGGEVEGFEDGFGGGGCVLGRGGGELLAAHGHDAMKEAAGGGHGHERGALRSAAGLAEDEDAGRVSAEGGDVVADPLEGEDEIELAGVSGVAEEIAERGRSELGEVEVAEEVETVVEGDDDGVAATG